MTRSLACVEVGGSSTQTVVFASDTTVVLDGAHQPPGARLALAVPGLLDGHRVVSASNLGWTDVDPVVAMGLRGPAEVVCNDAEAAAVGEAALRGLGSGDILVYVGLGTGIGGAVVDGADVVASNLFGHAGGFGDAPCPCGRWGCLETVAAGWAVPAALGLPELNGIAAALARAITASPDASDAGLIVVAGGIARRYPAIVDLVGAALPARDVVPSAATAIAKSAAPWGLRRLVERDEAVTERGTQ
jgi:predicted NBD/HSP70 family sugar kinase